MEYRTRGVRQLILAAPDLVLQTLSLAPGRGNLGLHLFARHIGCHFAAQEPLGNRCGGNEREREKRRSRGEGGGGVEEGWRLGERVGKGRGGQVGTRGLKVERRGQKG